jgi:DNA-binding protein HU-beta
MIYKEEFIERLAQKGYTKRDAGVIMEDFLATVTELLTDGESVMFRGFGNFEVRNYAAKEVISPSTKEPISVPAYKAPHFTPGKLLKQKVKDGVAKD